MENACIRTRTRPSYRISEGSSAEVGIKVARNMLLISSAAFTQDV